MTEVESVPIQTLISEFRNISPEITNAFMFDKDGKVIASLEEKRDEQTKRLIAAFNGVGARAETIGGIGSLTILGSDSQISIVSMSDRFLATVSSKTADPKVMKSLTTVVVPMVVKLLECPEPECSTENGSFPEGSIRVGDAEEQAIPKFSFSEVSAPVSFDSVLPSAPVHQVMVERISGLLASPDTVRVNCELVDKWYGLYGDRRITRVHIETLEGRAVVCKFKSAKDGSGSSKGTVQIPDKILEALETSKGNLVMIKPVAK